MLRRAVQKRSYDWEPLLSPVLQAYRSTLSESTGFTPFRLVFGREMRLPIDFGSPLPELPRDIRTLVVELTENLEWAYRLAREMIGHGHRRAENRYNDRTVEKLYRPRALVRVIQHTHHSGVPAKLNPKYSGFSEILEVRGPILSLQELNTRRVFTANHDSVRSSSLPHPNAPPVPVPSDWQIFKSLLDNSVVNAPVRSQPLEENSSQPIAEPDSDPNFEVPSLLDLELSPPPAIVSSHLHSLRARPTRRTGVFTSL